MTTGEPRIRERVIKFAQELLVDEREREAITPSLIDAMIDRVLAFQPGWAEGLDRQAVFDELIRRFSQWIGNDTTLKSDAGHIKWLTTARKRDWRYWQRYREWLERRMSVAAVDGLESSTDHVLGLLEDPQRDGAWDRRGLVVGHVQSGKTSHYTGVICKAADAGYKIIIVLAGLHNNLRAQTQMRLDEGFLGYETRAMPGDLPVIGVGEIDGDPAIRPNYVTNRSENGDFNTAAARHLGISPEQRPWLFVVKKNKTVLERLLRWIRTHVADTQDQESGRRVVARLPLLLIDDESDHGSVDTGEQVFDADGDPDEDHQPTAINGLIRRILHSFACSAYVGYTATPFANIFIHERGVTRDEGPDLFPSSFIVSLAAASDYIGPARMFGIRADDDSLAGLPVIRRVTDFASGDGTGGWMPTRHRRSHMPLHDGRDELPPSLIAAVDSFLLACAVRQLRGQEAEHASMLIHVTRLNDVQKHVHRQVQEHVTHVHQRLARRIGHAEIEARLERLWIDDFIPTTELLIDPHGMSGVQRLPDWAEILEVLPDVIGDTHVRMINGTARDALDYSVHKATGLKVIAIGGDKLARGLTLEGLMTSYFLRASKMYDTLMQMGRWFGYRPGYLDLCRLYTTSELVDWFGHIAQAAEELRQEFDLMAESGGTPRDYGLRVQSHPTLLVTSRLKMRTARRLDLSFSGSVVETVALYRDVEVLASNLEATRRLLSSVGEAEDDGTIERLRAGRTNRWKGKCWSGVPAAPVLDFLAEYRTHPAAQRVNGTLLAEFIRSLNEVGELTSWTIAVIGGEGEEVPLTDRVSVPKTTRKPNDQLSDPDRYSIGRLLSPRDESLDLDEAAWNAALGETRRMHRADAARSQGQDGPDQPNGVAVRKIRGFGAEGVAPHPERGLLLLYALDPVGADLPLGSPPVIAFGISFPGSNAGRKVSYQVNNVLWEQEYGPSE